MTHIDFRFHLPYNFSMRIETIKNKAFPVFKEYGVIKASVFGSVARGDDKPESDIDLLVELRRPFALSRFVSLKRNLENTLNHSVDVVEYGGVKPAFAPSIIKDAKVIYEQR